MCQFTELCGQEQETARIRPLISYLNLYLDGDVDENTLSNIKSLTEKLHL